MVYHRLKNCAIWAVYPIFGHARIKHLLAWIRLTVSAAEKMKRAHRARTRALPREGPRALGPGTGDGLQSARWSWTKTPQNCNQWRLWNKSQLHKRHIGSKLWIFCSFIPIHPDWDHVRQLSSQEEGTRNSFHRWRAVKPNTLEALFAMKRSHRMPFRA